MKRKQLINTLELLKPALADYPLVRVFECFVFTGEKVYASNDELAIVVPFKTDHAYAVNGRVLLGLLHASTSEDVTMNPMSMDDGFELIVKTGRSTFKLPYFDESEFLWEEPSPGSSTIICTEALHEGIYSCLTTAGRDTARSALMGVRFAGNYLYSCDGDAVTRIEMPTGFYALVPNSFCEAFLNCWAEGGADLGLNSEWISLTLGSGLTVYGRLLQIDNPVDHEQVIKDTIKDEPAWFPVPDGLNAALGQARVVADAESAKTTITIENGSMRLLTETAMGTIKNSVPVKAPPVKTKILAELWHRSIRQSTEMDVQANCTMFRNEETGLFRIISNIGE